MCKSSSLSWLLSVLIIVLFSDVSFAQEKYIDSLKSILPTVSGVARVDLKNTISRRLIYISPAEAESLILENIEEGKDINYMEGLALAIMLRGTLENNGSDFSKAKKTLNEAIEMAESIDYQEGLAYAKMGLGALYIRTRELTLAFEIQIQGIEAARKINNSDLELTYLMNIGVIKQLLEDYDEAEKYFKAALSMSKNAKLLNRTAQIYGNLGIVAFKRQNYGNAIDYQSQALNLFRGLNIDTQSAISLLNIGLAQAKLGKVAESMNSYDETLELRIKLGDSLGMARAIRYKGELKLQMKEYPEADQLLTNALSISKKFNDQNLLSEIYQLRYQLYQSKSDFKNALESYEQYVIIKDSLRLKANQTKITRLTAQFDFDKLESENELQLKENEIKDLKIAQRNNLLLAFLILFTVLILWSIWNRRQLKSQLAITQKDNVIAHKEGELRGKEFESEKMELIQYANQLLSKNEELEDKRLRLENIINSGEAEQLEIDMMVKKLRSSINDEKDWAAFKLYFDAVFPSFFNDLKRHIDSELTMYEQRLLALMKITLSNKEIGGILNISRSSVVRAKYRLRLRFDFRDTKEFETFLVNN